MNVNYRTSTLVATAKLDSDLVGHIAGFTSLRDIDLLELSLLKSIYNSLRPIKVSLIQLDVNNIILKRIDYSSEQFGNVTLKVDASTLLLDASEQLDRGTKEYCTVSQDNMCMTLFLLSQNRRVTQYVCIEASGDIVTQADSLQITGMLRVFLNFRALLKESQTDELTGLPNRKAFNNVSEKINEAILLPPEVIAGDNRKYEQSSNRFWLALVDLDDFKNINDELGHLMGDEVLVRVSQTMQASLRDADMIFRYGGEEFAIIINAQTQDEAFVILERMRANIEAINIQNIRQVTVSIGVVEMIENIFTMTLLENADNALYESKGYGKNQITFVDTVSIKSKAAIETDIEIF